MDKRAIPPITLLLLALAFSFALRTRTGQVDSAATACLQDLQAKIPNSKFHVEEIQKGDDQISVVLRNRNDRPNADGFVRCLYSVSAASGEILGRAVEIHENR